MRAELVALLRKLRPRRRQLRSIRFRLTIWYTAVLAAMLLVFGLALYALLVRTQAREADQDATRTAQGVAAGTRTLVDAQTGQLTLDLPDLGIYVPDIFVQVTDLRDGQALARSPNLGRLELPGPSPSVAAGQVSSGEFSTFEERGTRFRLFNRPIADQGQVVAVIQVARSLADDDRLLRRLRLLLLAMGGLALPASAALGWILAGRALAPVGQIARATEVIGRARDFHRRVVYSGPPDELGHLARMINSMLAELDAAHQGLAGVNARLAEANASLERALAAQQRFVAAASHELRTPITIIRANADVLRWTEAGDAAERARALDDIAGEAERMSRLVDDLLTLARADAGQQLELRPTPLWPLLDEVVRQARLLARGQRLSLEVTEEQVLVQANPDALKQLMLILLDNAIKYTPPPGQVTIGVERQPGEVLVSVTDTGVGIDPLDLPRVFEPFYRADATRDADGSGLGLTIAQWITEQHAGRIEIDSAPSRGSCFTVRLPIASAAVLTEDHRDGAQQDRQVQRQ